MKIKCAVSCRSADGTPTFFPTIVHCSQEKYDNGEHYEIADAVAYAYGYETGHLVYDENDGPTWLFANLFKESM